MADWTTFLGVALQLSIGLLVFAIGLRTTWAEATYLFRRPRLLAQSIVARNVIVPVLTLLMVRVMKLDRPVAGALLALSVAAVPPFLPSSVLRAGGSKPYVISLLSSQSMLAVVFVPVTLLFFNAVLSSEFHFAPSAIVPIVVKLTLFPLALGMAFRRWGAVRSERLAPQVQKVAAVILVAGMSVILVMLWETWMKLLGNGTLLAMILFAFIGLGAGHLLGGPRFEDRKTLALACASSNPALAAAIVDANAAPVAVHPALAAVLLYLIVQALVTLPYKRHEKTFVPVTLYRSGEDRRKHKRPGPDRRGAVI
jgi:bile acid:Na+ symporter, BASS family